MKEGKPTEMDREIPLSQRRQERRKLLLKIGIGTGAVIAVIVFLAAFLKSSISSNDLMIAEVDRGPIEITVYASGTVTPLVEEIVISPINTRILEVYKNPGDKVEAGEPLLKLELLSVESEYKQKLDEREMHKSKLGQVAVEAQNKISEMEMQRQIKEMQLKQLQTDLQSERYLDSIGASTADKVRRAELGYDEAQLELRQLAQKIANQRKLSEAELRVKELEFSIFEKTLAESARLLENARIPSPLTATLTFINNQIGAQVTQGTQIAVVSDLSRFKVEGEVADSYAEKVAVGTKAIVEINQQEKLTGTLINVTPSTSQGVIQFRVMLDDPGNPVLRSGQKTNVHINHGLQQNVLRIPPGKINYQGRGAYDLWIIKNGKAEKRRVQLGDSSFEYIEVLSGLTEGESVIINNMDNYKNKETLKIKSN